MKVCKVLATTKLRITTQTSQPPQLLHIKTRTGSTKLILNKDVMLGSSQQTNEAHTPYVAAVRKDGWIYQQSCCEDGKTCAI